jgi:hypothetical protein
MDQDGLPRIRDKFDIANAKALAALGYPAVKPMVPHLLEWIQDGNWPVAHVVAAFLASLGSQILPEIRAVLAHPSDAEWKWFCIKDVLAHMEPAAVRELRPELERLAFSPSERDKGGEVDQVARELLAALDRSV